MSNPYYDPEQLGLQTVGEISFNDDSYQFDMGIVWWHPEQRRFYYAEDSGCSCPSPFEDYVNIESLGEPLDLSELTSKLRSLSARDSSWAVLDQPIGVQVSSVLDRARELVSA